MEEQMYFIGRCHAVDESDGPLPACAAQVFQLSRSFITQEVRAINSLRGELQRMGLGSKLGNWKQLTSGGHAILLFNKARARATHHPTAPSQMTKHHDRRLSQ